MFIDKEQLFSNLQAVTATAASTSYIDLSVSRDIGIGRPALEVFAKIGTAALSTGSSTLVVGLETDTQSDFSTKVVLMTTDAIPKASLIANYDLLKWKVPGGVQRYLRMYYTVAVADLTAGTIYSGLILNRQAQAYYASGLRTTGF